MSNGYAVRVLFRSGRRYDDLVLYQPDETQWEGVEAPTGGEYRVLSCEPISASESGPTLIVDRTLPVRFADPSAWIEVANKGLIPDFQTTDYVREPMPEEQFWEIISVMDGVVDDESIERITELLSDLAFADVVRFRDSLWRKLHELDHPDNTVRTEGAQGTVLHADDSLYYRCEIIARGKDAYVTHLHAPQRATDDDGAYGEALLSVAGNAAQYELGDTDLEIETGRNGDHWPGVKPRERHPWETLPSVTPFSPRALAPREVRVQDPVLSRSSLTSFVAYAADDKGGIRELMGCLMATSFDLAHEELTQFLAAQLRTGETLDSRVRVWQTGASHPMIGVAMTGVSRRSPLSIDQYIDVYYNGNLNA